MNEGQMNTNTAQNGGGIYALLTQGILGFIGHYNEYMGPLLYLPSAANEELTLQLVLRNLTVRYQMHPNEQMGLCLIAMMPMLLLYLFLQNYILKGISMSSGLKG